MPKIMNYKDIMSVLLVSPRTAYRKMRGEVDFTLKECMELMEYYGIDSLEEFYALVDNTKDYYAKA